MRSLSWTLPIAFACALAACRKPAAPEPPAEGTHKIPNPVAAKPWFEDETPGSGVDVVYRNGEEAGHYSILESLGGGVGVLDYDGDGLLDLLFATGGGFKDDKSIVGHPCKLFRNEGNWKFRDVTKEAGLDSTVFYSHGVAVGDFDDDGWPDVLITGYGRMALFRNAKGRFQEITHEAGLEDPTPSHWSTSALWADFNGDGKLDLLVPHYVDWSWKNHPPCIGYIANQNVDVCPPERFKGLTPALYWNEGNGKFRLAKDMGFKPAKALGAVAADLDGDGKLDFYLANDGIANHFYRNLGNGKFEETAERAGVAYDADGNANGSMGAEVGDPDGAGKLSLFVANYENEMHCLYRNVGKGEFQCVSRTSGITSIGLSYVAFGCGFFDFDRNGVLDLFIANGHVIRHPARGERKQKPVLLRNQRLPGMPGPSRFAEASELLGSYGKIPHLGRGVAFGDLDNDGRVDIVISHSQEPATLLRNQSDSARDWMGVELKGKSPRDPVGAVVTFTQGEERQTAVIKGGGSYLSTSDRRLQFAVKKEGPEPQLRIRWPDGSQRTVGPRELRANAYVAIAQEGAK